MGDQFPGALGNAANQRVQPAPVEKAGEDNADGAVGSGEAFSLDAVRLRPDTTCGDGRHGWTRTTDLLRVKQAL